MLFVDCIWTKQNAVGRISRDPSPGLSTLFVSVPLIPLHPPISTFHLSLLSFPPAHNIPWKAESSILPSLRVPHRRNINLASAVLAHQDSIHENLRSASNEMALVSSSSLSLSISSSSTCSRYHAKAS